MNGELHQAPTGGMQPPLTDDEMLALVGVSNPEVVRLISSTLGRELCLAVFRAMLSRDSASRDFLAMLLAQLSERSPIRHLLQDVASAAQRVRSV